MSLERGSKLGPYEILGPIGAGGMGEVYRARDPKLKRDVAIKVLPADFAEDAERMQRFEREAQVLASLNHPHIAAIYGLEQNALILELVEGPTLADRIAGGPIALEDALPIAKQIAHAVEYAHESGIIHRDLKPANVKLTRDGDVKVLDFGLAKALGGEESAELDDSHSPTLTRAGTEAGVLLGTAAYMAPEQAKGKAVDRRADIWAFGVVLFEMLTGQRLFSGETASETLAAVIKDEIDWSRLPPGTPRRVRELLRRCLTRDPKERLQAIGEARIAMDRPEEEDAPAVVTAHPPRWRRALPWVVAGLLGLALVAVLSTSTVPNAVTRLNAEIGVDASLYTDHGSAAALSPDGSVLAFAATSEEGRSLFVRRLEDVEATPLPGTEDARNPFFSPDGQWLGFFAQGKLKKIAVAGGAAVTLADATNDRGGSWSEDGTIVFAAGNREPLSRVSAAGGAAEMLTSLSQDESEVTHRWPRVLPRGGAVVFTASAVGNDYTDAHIAAYELASGETRIVHRGGFDARYLESGHLVYVHGGTLFAVPFDVDRLELTGSPVPVLENVLASSFRGAGQYAASSTGTLIHVPGGGPDQAGQFLEWMHRDGERELLRSERALYGDMQFSPDGRRLAVAIAGGRDGDVWVYDLARDTLSRLTFEGTINRSPVWTPDGKRITFRSDRDGGRVSNLYWTRADGTGGVERLTEHSSREIPTSWHPSGKLLAFVRETPATVPDIFILPMEGDDGSGFRPGEAAAFLESRFVDIEPAFSPDGKWIAYTSNESGRMEIYVRPFPGPGGKWQISVDGGRFPTWSPNENELLFYDSGRSRILASTYTVEGDVFRAARPELWSEGELQLVGRFNSFALHPDGDRVVVATAGEGNAQEQQDKLTFISNFFEELERLAPSE